MLVAGIGVFGMPVQMTDEELAAKEVDSGYQIPVRPVTIGATGLVGTLAVQQVGRGFVLGEGRGRGERPEHRAQGDGEAGDEVPHGARS